MEIKVLGSGVCGGAWRRRNVEGKDMEVKVLGPGCPNCKKMMDMALQAVSDLGVDATVDYVQDMAGIMKYVMTTPGLVVDGKVKHAGRPLPSQEKVKQMIREEMP